MKTYARHTGICIYCLNTIEADATPREMTKGFWGPLNVLWGHVDEFGDPVDGVDHQAVPRGPTQTKPNSERFNVEPYGEVETLLVPVGVLEVGHQFVGPDHDTVYEVTAPVRDHPRGWLFTRRVTLIGTPCPDCERRGAVSAECGGCGGKGEAGHGFFTLADADAVHLITSPPVGP